MAQPINIESGNQEIMVCSILAAVAIWSLNKLRGLRLATLTFLLHVIWASFVLFLILGGNDMNSTADVIGRAVTTLGMPLMAAEAGLAAYTEKWKAYIHLVIPLADFGAYVTSSDKQLNPQLLLFSKALSIGFLGWIAHKSIIRDISHYGYLLTTTWIAAEYFYIHSGHHSPLLYPTLCAVADYFAELFFISLSPGAAG